MLKFFVKDNKLLPVHQQSQMGRLIRIVYPKTSSADWDFSFANLKRGHALDQYMITATPISLPTNAPCPVR